MKRKSISLLMLLIVSINIWAFKYGDLYYNITSNTFPYEVEVAPQQPGTSEMYPETLVTADIPDSIVFGGKVYMLQPLTAHLTVLKV